MRSLASLAVLTLLIMMAGCAQQDDAAAVDEAPEATEPAAVETSSPGQALPPRANEARPSPNASVTQTIGTRVVTITYGRPGVKGRTVYGDLVPYGAVWRTGANEATVFSTTGDVTINGEALPAGTYAFFAIPEATAWTLIFNRQAAQWGAFDYDESQDALRVTATPETAPQQEWLSYHFENLSGASAAAVLHWDTVRVPFTIAAP